MKIAFGSNARVGKSEASNYLVSKNEGVVLNFSDPVYDIMYYTQRVCGFSEIKDRDLLRLIGTWARNKDADTWVNILINKILHINNKNIFVSDVRFPNEYDALKKLGFLIVKIERSGNENLRNHESETALEGYEWDFIIDNNGSLEDFHDKLDKLCFSIKIENKL